MSKLFYQTQPTFSVLVELTGSKLVYSNVILPIFKDCANAYANRLLYS